jgi:PAS domain S-box-containing protein
MNPPVRELLSNYLVRRQDAVLKQLLLQIGQSPDLQPLHEVSRGRDYQQSVSTLLHLMVRNIADPKDRRCFHYAYQRAQERFSQNISATIMLRLASLHRQTLLKMVQEQFSDDTTLLRRMSEIIDAQLDELELTFAEAYQNARDRQWQTSETKYFSLFENASEAIISFRPGQGRIIEVNMQAERLLGRPRHELLGLNLVDLFPSEHQEQMRWLIDQAGGSSNVRLEDMAVCRISNETNAEGETIWLEVPISLSCNWITVDGEAVAQAILRDVTQLRQMQRELQNYAEQLEERVAARTRELQQSEERYRALFLQEQRRAQHLSLINEAQRSALETRDIDTFLHSCTLAIQSHFRNCDVTFFLSEGRRDEVLDTLSNLDEAVANQGGVRRKKESQSTLNGGEDEDFSGDLIAVAQAGGHDLAVPLGGRHPLGMGLIGQAAQRGETLHYAEKSSSSDKERSFSANLIIDDPQSSQSHPAGWDERPNGVYRQARSEMGVPVLIEGHVVGVISVQSSEPGAFDARDAVALQTVSTIIASHILGSRLFREMGELNQFNQTLINTMLHSLMVLDRDVCIQVVNDRLCQTLRLNRSDVLGQSITRVFGESVTKKHRLEDAVRAVTESGIPREVPEVQVWTPESTMVFDLRLFRVYFRGEAQVVALLINITQRWRKTHQLQLMHEMGRFFQASLDINKVLYTVLTCITAGSALGFNRAFLLLRDNRDGAEHDVLSGAMALGPSSANEASRIWNELSQRNLTLQEILVNAATEDATTLTPLQESILSLNVDLDNPAFRMLEETVQSGRAQQVRQAELFSPSPDLSIKHRGQLEAARQLFTAPEFAIAPLIAKERVVGVVLADNLYSGAPIDADDIQLLDTLAQQAGLTIDNALTYQALQKAQRELVSAERLAAVGEMAARVSHEIRNPLATVGGFARSVLKKPSDEVSVTRKTQIIVDEVARLEELLSDLLDMARPRQLNLQTQDLNAIVDHALLLANADIQGLNVTVKRNFDANLPLILVDRSRLLQALLNTIRNGAQAMQQGGVLEITTRVPHLSTGLASHLEIEVKDHGIGISERGLKQIFDPFFSTKISGSGLGLAVTRRIIQDHGGDIDVYSQEGQGTTFILCLPMRLASCPVIYEKKDGDAELPVPVQQGVEKLVAPLP